MTDTTKVRVRMAGQVATEPVRVVAKRGRPKSEVSHARERAVFVRVSADEYQRFEEAAERLGLPVATWLRSVAVQMIAKK